MTSPILTLHPFWGSVRLATDWPVGVVFAVAIIVGLIVMALYARESRVIEGPLAWILPGLRGTTVALAILMLASPVWHRSWVVGSPTRVVFAVDRSTSMATTDTQASVSSDSVTGVDARPTRLDRATDLLLGTATRTGWVESLSETHRVDVMAFSSGQPELVIQSNEDTPWRGSDLDNATNSSPETRSSDESADRFDNQPIGRSRTAREPTWQLPSELHPNVAVEVRAQSHRLIRIKVHVPCWS